MKKRFTLTEVLVVVFLIGLLTAIGFGMYGYAMNSAREKATRSLFARLEAGLESCNTKFGYIPTSTGSNFNVIKVTVSDGEISELDFGDRVFKNSVNNDKEYLKEFQRIVELETLKKSINSKTGELEDSWGATVYYCYPGKFNKTGFDLYSLGADGRMGKANDAFAVGTLNGGDSSKFKDPSDNSMACDDIVNF